MKIVRLFCCCCLLLGSLLAFNLPGIALAQEPELISAEEETYALALTPTLERYSTIVVAGQDKYFPVEVENLGTAVIDNITFSSDVPEGWALEFLPDKVDSLEALDGQTIEVKINAPSGSQVGDYMIALGASGEQASADKIDIRINLKSPGIEEKIEARAEFPSMETIAGGELVFQVEFRYTGEDAKEFELRPTPPQGWEAYMTPTYEKEKKVKSIMLKPSMAFGDKLRVVVSPPFWPLPEPGEYIITIEAVSGEFSDSAELTAVITAKYILTVVPATERYNTTARAGEDNFFSIKVQNFGTAPIDNIKFSSTKPEGWTIEFSPDKIDTLEAIDEQTIDVNIKPPPKAIAGDYVISLEASGKQTTAKGIDIRVTVESPTVWGWVGVAIILIVVAGLVVIFMRFSRR